MDGYLTRRSASSSLPDEVASKTGLGMVKVNFGGSTSDWRRLMESHFVKLDFDIIDRRNPPLGTGYVTRLGDLVIIRVNTHGGACRANRTNETIRTSNSSLFIGGLVIDGELTIAQAGQSAKLFAGDMAFMDSALEYSTIVPGGVDVIWVNIPRHRIVGRLALHLQSLARKIVGSTGLGKVLSGVLRTVTEQASEISNEQVGRLTNLILDLIVISLESDSLTIANAQSSDYSRKLLHRIKIFIEANLGNFQLSPKTISEEFGISIRYINRLLEKDGTSIARWIRIRRIERCRFDLESTVHAGETVAQIAFRNGFGSVSTFNRVFVNEYGIEPRALRGGTS